MVKRKLSGAYRLGFKNASEPKSSINYYPRLTIPINSFSNPSLQKKQYIRGWKAGRKMLNKNKKKR